MRMMRKIIYCALSAAILFQFGGCVSAAYIGMGALIDGKNASANSAVTPGVTGEQLKQIQKVTFVFGEKSSAGVNTLYNMGDLSSILEDNLTIEMMKLGYDCVSSQKIKKCLEEQGVQIAGVPTLEDSLKAGKTLGIHALIEGSLITLVSSNRSVLTTKSSIGSQIQSANIKLIDVATGNTLMVLSINYKRGESPDKAAKQLAILLKEKMQSQL